MNYKIIVTSFFNKQAKRLQKKYPSLRKELGDLIKELESTPHIGTPIGQKCYKVRFSIASKGKGKSGGARVITHVDIIYTEVYLLSIYDKSEQENISYSEIQNLLNKIP